MFRRLLLISFVLLFSACASVNSNTDLSHEEQVAYLTQQLSSDSVKTRIRAAQKLIKLGEEERTISTLLHALQSPRGGTRLSSARLLGTFQNPTPAVIESLELVGDGDIDREVRAIAKNSLTKLKLKKIIQ